MQKNLSRILKSFLLTDVHYSIFKIAKMCKHAKSSSTDEWIKKLCHIHAMEHYAILKRITCHVIQY